MSSEVTVVIPSYNHEKYILQTLQSCVNLEGESRPHFILVDDGSTDQTYELANQFLEENKASFTSKRLYKRKNSGLSASMNFALSEVKTKYMLMIASDDIFEKKIIPTLLSEIKKSPNLALVAGDNEFIDQNGDKLERFKEGHRFSSCLEYFTAGEPYFSKEYWGSYKSFLKGNYVPNGWLLDVEKISSLGGWDATFRLEDWQLLIRISRKFEVGICPQTTAKYRVHENNTVSRREVLIFFDSMRIYLQEYAEAQLLGLSEDWASGQKKHFTNVKHNRLFFKIFFSEMPNYFSHPNIVPFLSNLAGLNSSAAAKRTPLGLLSKIRINVMNDINRAFLSPPDTSSRAAELIFDSIRIYMEEFAHAQTFGDVDEWNAGVDLIWQSLLWNKALFHAFFTNIAVHSEEIGFRPFLARFGKGFTNLKVIWLRAIISIGFRKTKSLMQKIGRRLT